jgi:cell division protein FtsL
MRGRLTLFWVCLAVTVGFGLFHVKYKVQALEEDLRQLNAAITEEQEQLHVLAAEWAHLNRPDRLEALARKHTELVPAKPEQIGTVTAIPFPEPPDTLASQSAAHHPKAARP